VAIDYTNLFENMGVFIKAANQMRDMATGSNAPRPDLPSLESSIRSMLISNGAYDVLGSVPTDFIGYRDSAIGWAENLAGKVTELLTHRTTVLEQLPGLGQRYTLNDVLIELYRDMVANAKSVKPSVVTIGAVTADVTNHGNATVLLDKVLDGVNAPHPGFLSNREYANRDSELAVANEDMTLTCVGDEDTDGLASGEEVFLWEGRPPLVTGPFDWNTESSGLSTTVPMLNSHQIVSNANLESWNGNVPEGWSLDDGTAGTNCIQETTAADVYRGSSAMRLVGDGATATIKLTQNVPLRVLVPQQRYCFACYVKGDATFAAGMLTIQFESQSGGYTAAASERILMNAAALAAQPAYGLEYFYLTVPEAIPDDLQLVVKLTGAATNGAKVRVDSIAFGPVTYGNGISAVIIAGSNQTTRNDRYTFNVQNNNAGVFQTFARKRFKMQLYSDPANTINDNLAT
jgi:hypothetical protein